MPQELSAAQKYTQQVLQQWGEVSSKFDAMMPAATYDELRKHFFFSQVAPKLRELEPNVRPDVQFEEFTKRTERKPLWTPGEKLLGTMGLAATAGYSELLAPVAAFSDAARTEFERNESERKVLRQIAEREGMNTAVPEITGTVAGMALPMTLAWQAAGPATVGLATKFVNAGRGVELMSRMARGGLAFGTYEALRETEGDRLAAAAHGALWGAGAEFAFGLPKFLKARGLAKTDEAAEALARKTMEQGSPTPEVDAAVAEYAATTAQASRQAMAPSDYLQITTPGVRVVVKDAEGRIMALTVKPESEALAFDQVKQTIQQGGSFVRWEHGPDDMMAFRRAQGVFAKMNEAADVAVVPKIVRTPAGAADRVAAATGGTALRNDMVAVGPPRPEGFPEAAKVTAAFEAAQIGSGHQPQVRRMLEIAWDPAVPLANKARIFEDMQRMKLGELLPSQEQALRLTRKAPAAPSETPSEAAVARAEEITQRTKEAAEPTGVRGPEPEVPPARPRSGIYPAAGQIGIPPSEQTVVNVKPHRTALVLPQEKLDKLHPGFEGVSGAVIREGDQLERLLQLQPDEAPVMVIARGSGKETVYHEGIHYDLTRTGLFHEELENLLLTQMPDKSKMTINAIASELPNLYKYYNGAPWYLNFEEAFVHAAEAIRFGNAKALATLGRIDDGVNAVVQMVNDASKALREALGSKLIGPNRAVLDRRLADLIRRTDKNVSYELRRAADEIGETVWWDAESYTWRSINDRGVSHAFKSDTELYNYLDEPMRVADTAADASFWAQIRGLRGPLVPPGKTPTSQWGAVETPPPRGWAGFSALAGWFRPTGPWVATVHEKLQKALALRGGEMDLYGAWRSANEAVRAAEQWNRGMLEQAADILKGTGKKVHDYFQMLTYDRKAWPEVAQRLKIGPQDMHKVEKLAEWIDRLEEHTQIPVWDYLKRQYPQLRSFGWQGDMVWGRQLSPSQQTRETASFWDDAIRYRGEWDPREDDIGRFMNYVLRRGVQKVYLDKPLAELQRMVNATAKDGSFILGPTRGPLQNYINYVKGVPDTSALMINDAMHSFETGLTKRLGELHKRLPFVPKEFHFPKGLINKLLLLSYGGGLGARPSIPVRDTFTTIMTGLPLLGPAEFFKVAAKHLTNRASYKQSMEAGALLRKHNVSELHGDIFQELPGMTSGGKLSLDGAVRFSNIILQPARWGNNLGRNLMYHAGRDASLEALPAYRAGKITADELLRRTHMWFADDPVINMFLKRATDKKYAIDKLAHEVGRELTDLTQWPYLRGSQPGVLRTGVGRILGQYGYWPMHYIDYMRRMTSKAGPYRKEALTSLGYWAAINYAAVEGMESMGADTNAWFWSSPMAYAGGPHMDFALNLMKGMENTQQGREARRRVLEYPLQFFPGWVEVNAILKAAERNEAVPGPGLWRVLGFRPVEEMAQEPDMLNWLRYQAGYGVGGRNR